MTIYDTSNTTLLVNWLSSLYSGGFIRLKRIKTRFIDEFRIELMVRYQLRAKMAQKGLK